MALFLIQSKDDFTGLAPNASNSTTQNQWADSLLVTSDGIARTYCNTD
jgi:hypothetical protein